MGAATDIAIRRATLIERLEALAHSGGGDEVGSIARALRAIEERDSEHGEQIAATEDAVRATAFRLAAALPEAEREAARDFVRKRSIAEIALALPEWATRLTSADTSPLRTTPPTPSSPTAAARSNLSAASIYQLKQIANELEAPTEALEFAAGRLRRLDLELEAERATRSISAAAESLRILLNDLLDLASLSDGGFTSARIDFHVRDCLVAGLDGLRPRAQRARVALVLEVDDAVPEAVVGDPGRLRQVLHTLAGNAIEGGAGGEVRVLVGGRREGERLELDVTVRVRDVRDASDDGGLRRDSGAWVWRGGARTGLGLTIARQLVQRMGGRTWVGSAADGRSEIHFTVQLELPTGHGEPDRADAHGHELHVLVVAAQSEPIDRLLEQLRRCQCTAHPVTTAAAGRALAGERSFDAVIIVGSLASRRGAALVSEAAELGANGGPPVALLVRSGRRGDAARCRQLGIGAYLALPCADRDLRDLLRTLIEIGGVPSRRHSHAGGEALVTRHFLRESRRRLHVAWRCSGPSELGAMLEQLGHRLVAGDAFDEADLVLIDAVPCGTDARAWLDAQFEELPMGDRPPVLVVLSQAAAGLGVPAHAPVDEILLAPVSQDALLRVLPMLRGRNTDNTESTTSVDLTEIAARIGGDVALARELLRALVDAAPGLQTRVATALAGQDLVGAQHGARGLGAGLAHLGWRATAAIALDLAERCGSGDRNAAIERARELWPRLGAVLEAARGTLDSDGGGRHHLKRITSPH